MSAGRGDDHRLINQFFLEKTRKTLWFSQLDGLFFRNCVFSTYVRSEDLVSADTDRLILRLKYYPNFMIFNLCRVGPLFVCRLRSINIIQSSWFSTYIGSDWCSSADFDQFLDIWDFVRTDYAHATINWEILWFVGTYVHATINLESLKTVYHMCKKSIIINDPICFM